MRATPTQNRTPRRACILALGLMLLAAGCFGTTERDIKQAEIQYDMGVNELKAGRVREAMNNFMQAVDLHPEFALAHNGLGLALHLLGRNDQALEQFEKALELKPDFNAVRNNLARVYISQGRFREAIPQLKKALEDVFLPERYLAESNLGWALFQVGQEEEGMQRVMNALAQNERFCVGYEYLGMMYKKQEKIQEAIREFHQLIEFCPDYLTAHLNLGKILLMAGQVEMGCKHLGICKGSHRMSVLGRECERLLKASACPEEPAPSPR
jgi:type IV pilus assembly protein PilF